MIRRLPQPLPGTGAIAEYAELGNFGMRVVMSYQPNTLAQQFTVDVLYGCGVLRNYVGRAGQHLGGVTARTGASRGGCRQGGPASDEVQNEEENRNGSESCITRRFARRKRRSRTQFPVRGEPGNAGRRQEREC